MRSGINAVISRAKTTRHAQEDLQSAWIWNEKSLEQWNNEIADIQRAQEICSSAKFTLNSTRAALDAKLQKVRRHTMQFLAMAKFHFRHDPSILEALSVLTACGMGRSAIAKEAMDLETAWQKADPDWAPTEANTLASFQALRKQCTELEAEFIASHSAWRIQSEILNQKAEALNAANIAWYAAATRIFPVGLESVTWILLGAPASSRRHCLFAAETAALPVPSSYRRDREAQRGLCGSGSDGQIMSIPEYMYF